MVGQVEGRRRMRSGSLRIVGSFSSSHPAVACRGTWRGVVTLVGHVEGRRRLSCVWQRMSSKNKLGAPLAPRLGRETRSARTEESPNTLCATAD